MSGTRLMSTMKVPTGARQVMNARSLLYDLLPLGAPKLNQINFWMMCISVEVMKVLVIVEGTVSSADMN